MHIQEENDRSGIHSRAIKAVIAAAAGIILLLLLIIKFKIHPVLSLLISALFIGLGAGMPVPTLVSTVEKGAGEALQGLRNLIRRCVVLAAIFGFVLVEYDRNDKRWDKLDKILKLFPDTEETESEEV